MKRLLSPTEAHWKQLTKAARDVRKKAYAPYSNYLVGAALMALTAPLPAAAQVNGYVSINVGPPAQRVETPAPEPWSHLGYYNFAGASFGLQIGAQAYGLAMFFMTDAAFSFFRRTEGWEIGTGPSVVALDAGMAGSLTSSTMSQSVYSVTFGQQGLMATLSLEGTKITRIRPD